MNYFIRRNLEKIVENNIWLSAIEYQLSIGEIEMNPELERMISEVKDEIFKCKEANKSLKSKLDSSKN